MSSVSPETTTKIPLHLINAEERKFLKYYGNKRNGRSETSVSTVEFITRRCKETHVSTFFISL